MQHRSYRGSMRYLTNGVGEMGREFFSVTIQPDGTRTLRAQCEMDDDRLLRDVVITADARWRTTDAYVRLMIEERLVGTSWFRFDGRRAECEGWTALEGRISQVFETADDEHCFGTHALHGDAWVLGRLRLHEGPPERFRFVSFASSFLPNGGSGPLLLSTAKQALLVLDLGDEQVKVPAGTFATRHVRIEVPGVDHFDVWAGGEDCLPVRLTSDGLGQTYELVTLEGDWR